MSVYLGIDIGGTKIGAGLVDATGSILSETRLAVNSGESFETAFDRLVTILRELVKNKSGEGIVRGIGIGCTGPVDSRTGTIENPYTLPGWMGHNIVAPLHAVFGVPVLLENDADAALAGEMFVGAGQNARHAVMLTFGTGVGGAVWSDGRLHRGANDEHAELGHIPVDHAGPACYCGTNGCLESIASGPAIQRAAREVGFADAQEVFLRAGQGDAKAGKIIDRVTGACIAAVWTILHAFRPEVLILGGGIMESHFGLFAAPLRNTVAKAVLLRPPVVRVERAALGNKAGMVGAARLAREASNS